MDQQNKLYLSEKDLKKAGSSLCQQMAKNKFVPDLIITIQRGGLVLATMLSHYYNSQLFVITHDMSNIDKITWLRFNNVLFIDEINDSGNTYKKMDDYMTIGCKKFNSVFKTAAWVEKTHSSFACDYVAYETNSLKWIVFPWENWWELY